VLLETIDEVLKTTFGDRSTRMIYDYLRLRSCPTNEIPQKPEIFSMELRSIFFKYNSPARLQTSVPPTRRCVLIERAILKILCKKMGFSLHEIEPINFASAVSELRIFHNPKKKSFYLPLCGKEETEKN